MSGIALVGAGGTLGALLVERLRVRGIELRCGDAREDRFAPEIGDADVVVNVGGPRVRPGLRWGDYFREHVGVTARIARSMRRGAHLVHLSSTAVYGARGGMLDASSTEAPTLFPSAAYACAKLAAETTARALGREKGLCVTVLRPSMVYGAGVDSALGTVRKLHRHGVRLRLRPDGVRQHLLHVDLLVRAVERATIAPRDGTVLLVADPFVLSNADLAPSPGAGVPFVVDVRAAAAAHEALARALGVAPKALEALAVLGLDNSFDVGPTLRTLEIDPGHFERAQTFDRYWHGAE